MDHLEQLRNRLDKLPDDRLLDIVEGRDLGYREEAVRIAQEILHQRGVSFTPVPFAQLDLTATEFYAEVDQADYLRQHKKLGRSLLVIGLGIFVLPFFGLQFRFAKALGATALLVGVASIAAGAYVLSRAERMDAPPPGPDAESRDDQE